MYKQIATSLLGIGVADKDLTHFENQYPLTEGVTYNSYVVTDGGCTAVIDAVDRRRGAEWLEHLKAAAPDGVDYLVVQHMEPDHSAMIAEFMVMYPQAKIVASLQAVKMMQQFFPDYDFTGRTITVKEGSTLAVGSRTLTFYTAAMVHWPEVIVTYDAATGTLFSADGFGTFGTSDSFEALWPDEARRYYANIVGKYGPQVSRVLDKLATLDGLKRVCTLHGPVLEGDNLAEALRLYRLWSAYKPELPEGVLVAYSSIYGHTADVALRLATMLEEKGVAVTTVDLCRRDQSEAVAEAFRMGRIVVAAPTYDGGMFPAMHNFLYHLQIKALRGRRFGIIENGSWAPVAGKAMASMISELKDCEVVEPVVTIKSAPDASTPAALEALAAAIMA